MKQLEEIYTKQRAPDWGTPESVKAAKEKTPYQTMEDFVSEEVPATSTASIPDSTNTGPINGGRKRSVVTKRYIEILGMRKRREV